MFQPLDHHLRYEDAAREVDLVNARNAEATDLLSRQGRDAALVDRTLHELGHERIGEVEDVVVLLETCAHEGMDDAAPVNFVTEHVTDVCRGRETLGRESEVDQSKLFSHSDSSRALLVGVNASTMTRAQRASAISFVRLTVTLTFRAEVTSSVEA